MSDTGDIWRTIRSLRDRISVLEEQLAAVEAIASGELQRNREAVERLTAVVESFTEIMRAGEPGPLGTVHPIRPEEGE